MKLTVYISTLIHERDVQLNINDSKPGGDIIANAKAEQILDNLSYLYREAKSQVDVDVMNLLHDAFDKTYYKFMFL